MQMEEKVKETFLNEAVCNRAKRTNSNNWSRQYLYSFVDELFIITFIYFI